MNQINKIFNQDRKINKTISDELITQIQVKVTELCKLLTENNIGILELDNQEKLIHLQKLSQDNFNKYAEFGNYDPNYKCNYFINDYGEVTKKE